MIELLCPAGSMEALRAAVQNGADAVYLGYDAFNARMGAQNFSVEQLQEAIVYCHVRGVKVHLTLNTLVADRELSHAAEVIRTAALLGVDAFIVQDLGVAALCRELAPEVDLHASTQMSIHSLEGAKAAAELGVKRVVLARELPRKEIAYICQNSPVETEVFAHGALCMCYSGQCYLSAVIGRRSGNRGQCAQPCRMAYGYGRFEPTRYPLSLKDNCLVQYLDELKEMGVASVKIEGRMKRPEYVAVVTRIYRAALDGKSATEEDLQKLERIFSRQGFTQGYYLGETGAQMFGVREDTEEDKQLLAEARATYENGENARIDVTFYAIIRRDEPAQIAVQDADGHVCKTTGPVPEEAMVRSLTQEALAERLGKTGGTPYRCAQVKAVIDDGLTLSAAAVNAMRRDVLAELTARRGRAAMRTLGTYVPAAKEHGVYAKPELTVFVRNFAQITQKMLAMQPSVLYVPLSVLAEHPELPAMLSVETQLAAVLPRVVWSGENAHLAQQLKTVYDMGVRQVLTGNLGQVRIAKAAGFVVRGDFGLNIFNSRSMKRAQELGLESQLLSFEMTMPQIRDISKDIPSEVMVYGRLPLMLTENCLIKGRTGTCGCDSAAPVKLIDRMGEEFPIIKDQDTCRSVLLNGKKLYLLDKLESFENLGLWALRLQFTTENPTEVDAVLTDYRRGGVFDVGSYTRGLYARGVE
ncbi:MAG: U32 family peptidase [Oscillospiraceae bacterium]|nr:U32 family peptidase [Oscillospiraceae bacterium]